MKLKQLLSDDDAVSPVIGVILMVAITVILAAVIATFVLGLGDSVSDTAPQASFSTDFNQIGGSNGNLTFTHDGGDTIKSKEIYVRGQNGSNGPSYQWSDTWAAIAAGNSGSDQAVTSGTNSSTKGGQSASVAGDYIRMTVNDNGEINLVWEPSSGDQSATMVEWKGPAA